MGMTIAIRADAGVHHGAGHMMRCLALAQELKQLNAQVVWLCREQADDEMMPVKSSGIEVITLPGRSSVFAAHAKDRPDPSCLRLGAPWEWDALETTKALTHLGMEVDWLIVDHYGIDRCWEERLGREVGRVLRIEDMPVREHVCDVLLDQTSRPRDETFRPLVPSHCLILSGTDYALINPRFHALRSQVLQRRREQAGSVRRILVSVGSTDPWNTTSVALEALDRSGFAGLVDVVVGPGASARAAIERAEQMKALVRVHIGVAQGQMAALMAEADLAVGAGGMTTWERCALGLPALVVATAENQRQAVQTLHQAGAAWYIGSAPVLDVHSVLEPITQLLHNPNMVATMGERAARLCDGLGARRVALHLIPVLARDGKPVTLRPARPSDCDRVYAWQQHPATRRFARNQQVPEYGHHRRWYAERLQDTDCIFNIVEHAGLPVGVVRLDAMHEPFTYEVSIFIDPTVQRRGIALAALTCARRLVPTCVLQAKVLPENTASQRLFEKAGYVYEDARQTFVHDPLQKE